MRKHGVSIVLAVGILVWSALAWAQNPYRWSLVRQGGKEEADTWVKGINDAQWFVFNYQWLDGSGDGAARFSKNTPIEFAVPGADGTEVEDIGASSTIVGSYVQYAPCAAGCGDGEQHAFMYRHGLNAYFTIDYPGAFWSFGFSVNNKNKAGIGFFREFPQGFVDWGAAIYDYSTKSFSPPVTAFGSPLVVIDGLNDHLDMAGTVTLVEGCSCEVIPWVRWKGVDYELSLPDGLDLRPTGINNKGDVVGWLFNGQSFKMNMGTGVWEVIEHPVNTRAAGWSTSVVDIANNGQMVASVRRVSDGYVEGWWLRPNSQVAKK